MRRSFKQSRLLNHRLSDHVERLQKEAVVAPAGAARDRIISLAKLAATASQIEEWLASPGVRAPQ
jgi:hypothetical protein